MGASNFPRIVEAETTFNSFDSYPPLSPAIGVLPAPFPLPTMQACSCGIFLRFVLLLYSMPGSTIPHSWNMVLLGISVP